jgi:NADH-quinone oxidoreductase subunit K
MNPIFDFFEISVVVFFLAVWRILVSRSSFIAVLVSLELILFAAGLSLVAFSQHLDDLVGQFFLLLVLTVAAAESAVGLAILVIFHRLRGSISVDSLVSLKG